MECHKCPHAEAVAAGKYRRVPFEKTPCAACEQVDRPGFAVAFDEERSEVAADAAPPARDAAVEQFRFPEEAEESEERMPVSVMREAVAALLCLPPQTRDVVCWRYAGMKYREIALIEKITMAAVELRHQRALRRFPALRALFQEKLAKQTRRKPYGGRR